MFNTGVSLSSAILKQLLADGSLTVSIVNSDQVDLLTGMPHCHLVNCDPAVYVSLTYTPVEEPASVPEPGSLILLGTGVAGVFARRYRRRLA